MDRETTQRLMRESIMFLCKTHLGHDARCGFEVDAIVCVSRLSAGNNTNAGYSDPRPTVFKFHERVTDEDGKAIENVNDWLLSGSSLSFVDSLLKQSDQSEPTEAKRRRTELNFQPTSSSYHHDGMQIADLSLVKQEPGYLEADELTVVKSGMNVNPSADQSQLTMGLRSADATGSDASYSRSRLETTGAKDMPVACGESNTAGGISELEKLVSKPVMSSPPPLKLMPSAADLRPSMDDEVIKRPSSCNSNGENRFGTTNNLVDDDLDDTTGGMEQSTPRSCDVCGLIFADFPSFNVHCATVHCRYACPFCELLFPCESTRERHLFVHTGETVDDDRMVNNDDDESHSGNTLKSSRRSIPSEIGKRQTDCWPADVAEMSDADDNSFSAVNGTLYDPKVMTRRGVLSCQTLRAIAQLDPSHPFVCDVCRSRFAESSELCDHCAAVHHRIPCPYCGRSFSQKASMERHQRQHTGERPYQCTLCVASYTRKENLQTHMSRMHGTSGGQQSGSEFICVE